MIQKIPFMAYLDDWDDDFINQTPALTNPTYFFFFLLLDTANLFLSST